MEMRIAAEIRLGTRQIPACSTPCTRNSFAGRPSASGPALLNNRGRSSPRDLVFSPARLALCSCSTTSLDFRKGTEPQEKRHQELLHAALKAALCAGALCVWLLVSARTPGTLLASATVAARGAGTTQPPTSALAGLFAGCLHSLSGPDHLAALTPLTIGRSSVKASLLGAWWGFGHCIGQLILGLLMLLLKDKFNHMLPMLEKYSSVTIGLTLVIIGLLGLKESLGEPAQQVEVTQETPPLAAETIGAMPRIAQDPEAAAALPSTSGSSAGGSGFSAWTLATGIVYGLQLDALYVVVPALAMPTRLAAAVYMGMFVAGTVTAMGSYTAFIGATSRAIQAKGTWLKVERLSAAASLVALVMGVSVVLSCVV